MNPNRTQVAYQEAAVRNANAIELVIMLYDILARDLHGAIDAMEAGNIETRSPKLKHGFWPWSSLKDRCHRRGWGFSRRRRFYSMLRAQMMKPRFNRIRRSCGN